MEKAKAQKTTITVTTSANAADKPQPTVNHAESEEIFAALKDLAEIKFAHREVARGRADIASYTDKIGEWKSHASLRTACEMLKCGFAAPADFADKTPAWIAAASPGLARKMVVHGIAKPSDFSSRLPAWRLNHQYSYWREFVRGIGGSLHPDEEMVSDWVKHATFDSAMLMVEDGLATSENFADRISSWIDYGPEGRTRRMAYLGVLAPDEAHETRHVSVSVYKACRKGIPVSEALCESCLQYGDGYSVHKLMESGYATKADVADRVDEWLDEVSPESAPCLLKYGFATADELRSHLAQHIGTLTVAQAAPLYKAGILTESDLQHLRGNWRANVAPYNLSAAVVTGVVSEDEAVRMFCIWGDITIMDDPVISNLMLSRLDVPSIKGRKVIGEFQKYHDGGAVLKALGVSGYVMPSDLGWIKASGLSTEYRFGDFIECSITKILPTELLLRPEVYLPEGITPIADQYPPGTRVSGEVASVQEYGLFVDFAPGLTGFVFRSEISWEHQNLATKKRFHVGDKVEAVVMYVNDAARKINLSMKRLTEDPWKVAELTCAPGTKVKGIIKNLAKYGVFVEVAPHVIGLVHRTDMDWRDMDVKVKYFNYKPGDVVDVMVKEFDAVNRRIVLSIKDTLPNPWKEIEKTYPAGKVAKGVVMRTSQSMAFVELPGGVTGLLHVSEFSDPPPSEMPLSVGDEVEVRVTASHPSGRMRLSLRALTMPDADFAALSDREAAALREQAAKPRSR